MRLIQRLIVQTPLLASIGYDAQRQMLEIELADGNVYRYLTVPASIYLALMNAPDKDEYYTQHIKEQFVFNHMK